MTPSEFAARQRATLNIGYSQRTGIPEFTRIRTGPDGPKRNGR
jgi:hypothetical protein